MVGMVSSDSASFPPGQGLAHLHAVPVDQHVAAESGEANEEAPQPRGGQMWPSGARRHPSPPPPPPRVPPRGSTEGSNVYSLSYLGLLCHV